jgi:hypothetical protein
MILYMVHIHRQKQWTDHVHSERMTRHNVVLTPHANGLVHRDHRAHLRHVSRTRRQEDRCRSFAAVVVVAGLMLAASRKTTTVGDDDDVVVEAKW